MARCRARGDEEWAARVLSDHAEAVRRRQLARALSRLEAHGDLTAAQREAVCALAARLTAGVVTPALVAVLAGEADPERLAALFDA